MLVRNLHFSNLRDPGKFCALIDFVDTQWDGASNCTFGDVPSGARRLAEYDPYAICFVPFESNSGCSAFNAADSVDQCLVLMDRIDADAMCGLATAGRDILCCNTSVNPPADTMFAHARWILARIWRTQAEPGVVVDERNTISKACHVLMCRSKCSEEDAFAALRARAMDRRMPLVKLASLVLDS